MTSWHFRTGDISHRAGDYNTARPQQKERPSDPMGSLSSLGSGAFLWDETLGNPHKGGRASCSRDWVFSPWVKRAPRSSVSPLGTAPRCSRGLVPRQASENTEPARTLRDHRTEA